ncbi:hypothetical protein WP12_16260 [Sphingomonas sp. SRS2]|nr:hypothetical protein WP12_16260 [Sphingomonas sp. SRS2]
MGLLLIGHRLRGYDLAIAVEGFQRMFQKLHADDRSAWPLMFLQDHRFALAVIDDLAEAVMGVGQFDRGEVVEVPFGLSRCHVHVSWPPHWCRSL